MPEISAEMAAIRQRQHAGWHVPEGCELVAVEHEGWRPVSGKRCRRQGAGRKVCTRDAVAELNRGKSTSNGDRVAWWWPYCAGHMYGNWIENGKVMHWILRELPADG